ncbi:hypothetical protein BJX61DRAFT_538791 [Aspergillus egyptiacus]|nr:hypothetical protein BJX61DRAFT_538791 [Aspergillus egyptiacus]
MSNRALDLCGYLALLWKDSMAKVEDTEEGEEADAKNPVVCPYLDMHLHQTGIEDDQALTCVPQNNQPTDKDSRPQKGISPGINIKARFPVYVS